MKILVINGPNLNMLGRRDPVKYGTITLDGLNKQLRGLAKGKDVKLVFFQSNHEGEIIDFLQQDSSRKCSGAVINPGALVRYGWCLRQALIDLGKPVVEVHMSNINKTGINKKVNVLNDVRISKVTGLREESYFEGLRRLVAHLTKRSLA